MVWEVLLGALLGAALHGESPCIHGDSSINTVYSRTRLYTGNTAVGAALHGCTAVYTAIHGYTRLYTAIHGYTRLYTAIQPYTRGIPLWELLYTAIHGYTRLYSRIRLYRAVQRYSSINTTVGAALHGGFLDKPTVGAAQPDRPNGRSGRSQERPCDTQSAV